MSNVVVVAIVQAKPKAAKDVRALLERTIAATHKEPGCCTYALHVSAQDPDQFVMVERWQDQAALDAHSASPHMREFASAVGDLVAAPPTILFTEPAAVGDPVKGVII